VGQDFGVVAPLGLREAVRRQTGRRDAWRRRQDIALLAWHDERLAPLLIVDVLSLGRRILYKRICFRLQTVSVHLFNDYDLMHKI